MLLHNEVRTTFPSMCTDARTNIRLYLKHRTISMSFLSNYIRLWVIRTQTHIRITHRIASHWSYNRQIMIYIYVCVWVCVCCALWYLVIVITSFITIKHTKITANNRIICINNVVYRRTHAIHDIKGIFYYLSISTLLLLQRWNGANGSVWDTHSHSHSHSVARAERGWHIMSWTMKWVMKSKTSNKKRDKNE